MRSPRGIDKSVMVRSIDGGSMDRHENFWLLSQGVQCHARVLKAIERTEPLILGDRDL